MQKSCQKGKVKTNNHLQLTPEHVYAKVSNFPTLRVPDSTMSGLQVLRKAM
jgi:hypothetical protein